MGMEGDQGSLETQVVQEGPGAPGVLGQDPGHGFQGLSGPAGEVTQIARWGC